MLASTYVDLGSVALPTWRGRQLHMAPFFGAAPVLDDDYEDFLPVVADLCERANHRGVAYLTVDEKIVEAGMSQRRPGAHVDGTWMPDLKAHGQPSPGHRQPSPEPPPRHFHGPYIPPQAIIVAASVPGCKVYPGTFHGTPKDDGDLEHIRDQLGEGQMLPGFKAFLLSPACVHESIRFQAPTKRTFIRIALEQ